MKRIIQSVVCTVMLLVLCAVTVNADKVYEYELSENTDKANDALSEFLQAIPEELRNALPEGAEDPSFDSYDVEFFAERIKIAVKEALEPCIGIFSILLGTVMVAAVFHMLSSTVGGKGLEGAFSFLSSLCLALCIFSSMETVFKTVESLLKVLSDTMLVLLPVMETVCISSGNLTASTVIGTGVNLMIGVTQSLFSTVIGPAVYAVFILAVVSSVTGNKCIALALKTLRGLITGVIILAAAFLTFVLALQSVGAQAADTLAQKTVKFALGTYLPLVGGAVADSFSMFSASIGLIKQWCGITGVVVLIIAFLSPFCVVLLSRAAVGVAEAFAAVLGCERERVLLCECKGICTLLIAVSCAACFMFVIALGVFCRMNVAVA